MHGSFFPKSYRLNGNFWNSITTSFIISDKQECKEFFSYINSKQYHLNKELDPIQFLLKLGNGPHRAMGLSILDEDLEKQVRGRYQNGLRCGEETKSFVAQQYISNPLVLDKENKFDFRIYMLVASVDPLIVYYHDGFLRVSLSKYDKNSKQVLKTVLFLLTFPNRKMFILQILIFRKKYSKKLENMIFMMEWMKMNFEIIKCGQWKNFKNISLKP